MGEKVVATAAGRVGEGRVGAMVAEAGEAALHNKVIHVMYQLLTHEE